MSGEKREHALNKIRENIALNGYHVYVVSGGTEPRFAYTIGLSQKIGKELIFAGGIFYMYEEVGRIISEIAGRLTKDSKAEGFWHEVDSLGSFRVREADQSWTNALMLGALDFYERSEIAGLQIVPDEAHWTIDVPNMTMPWSVGGSPAWRWLKEPWPYSVPPSAHASTNLDALRGAPITEACRWEEDYWELFAGAGPDIPTDQTRVVPLGTLLGADVSLLPVLQLSVGAGIWREGDGNSEWHIWRSSSNM